MGIRDYFMDTSPRTCPPFNFDPRSQFCVDEDGALFKVGEQLVVDGLGFLKVQSQLDEMLLPADPDLIVDAGAGIR
jgi:hypothetical protein